MATQSRELFQVTLKYSTLSGYPLCIIFKEFFKNLKLYSIFLILMVISIFKFEIITSMCICAQLLQLCRLRDPMECNPPSSSLHGILRTRKLEQVAMPSSRGSSRLRDLTHTSFDSCIASGFLITEPPGKPSKALKHANTVWVQLRIKKKKNYWNHSFLR